MSDQHLDIERLIVRRLDGELSDDESLALDRALLRDPEARRLEESYARIDSLAQASLGSLFVGSDSAAPSLEISSPPVRRRGRWGWWGVAFGAAAAACLALVVPPPAFLMTTDSAQVAELNGQQLINSPVNKNASGIPEPADRLMRNVSQNRPRIQRQTDRGVIGVMGDDGNLYWFEVERTQTRKRPAGRVPVPASLEEL